MHHERPPIGVTLAGFAIALGLFWGYFGLGAAFLGAIVILIAWSIGRSWDISAPPPARPAAPPDDGATTR